MKKLFIIVALVISLGVVGTMFGGSASAQFFRIPMATVVVGPGFGGPGWVAARGVPGCVPYCCVPYCAPVYACPPPVKAAKAKDTKAKTEKKEKKEKK